MPLLRPEKNPDNDRLHFRPTLIVAIISIRISYFDLRRRYTIQDEPEILLFLFLLTTNERNAIL